MTRLNRGAIALLLLMVLLPCCGDLAVENTAVDHAVLSLETPNETVQPIGDALYQSTSPYALVQNVQFVEEDGVIKVTPPAPPGDCTNVTSSPIVVGNYVMYAMHERSHCNVSAPYGRTILGFDTVNKKLVTIASGWTSESTLYYDDTRELLLWPRIADADGNSSAFGLLSGFGERGFHTVFDTSGKQVNQSVDSSPLMLNGRIYFGSVNNPDPVCQGTPDGSPQPLPLDTTCGSMYAFDLSGSLLENTNTDTVNGRTANGFRAWVAASPVSDGEYIYVGTGAQTYGESSETYRYGCSVVKFDQDLKIVAAFDPGTEGCRPKQTDADGNQVNMEDAPAGEPVLGPDDALWVQYFRTNDASDEIAVYRLNRSDLSQYCKAVVFTTASTNAVANFYQSPTIDKDGNLYATYSYAGKGWLYKITPQCSVQLLVELDSGIKATPTLADDRYVLIATARKLRIYTLGGTLRDEVRLASGADVLTSPIVHNGAIYVVAEDGALTVIPTSISGYGTAHWPRFRLNNHGTATINTLLQADPHLWK